MKRALVSLVAAAFAIGYLPAAGHAVDAVLTSYGADSSATAVHVRSYTNALTNFASGYLDNSYPLAASHLDAGPATQGVASVADTGPLGATGQGQIQANIPSLNFQQPQYAVATYPGAASATQSQGSSVAEATATQYSATARGAVAAAGTSGSVEQPDAIAHTSADEGSSSVSVDPATGRIMSTARGYVARASFGAGALVLSGVEVTATVATDGIKATPAYTIHVASATVNDTPVRITNRGVEVQDAPLPGSDAMTQVVNGQLNSALASMGLAVFVTAPTIAVRGAEATVEVTGVHVHATAPNPDPSFPTLTYDYVVGEARAFGFAIPASSGLDISPTLPVIDTGSTGAVDYGAVGGAVETLPAEVGAPALRPAPGDQSVAGLRTSLRRDRPTWLVPIYLVWQALMLATAGALVWARRG